MNKIVAVFAGEFRDDMIDSEVVDFIRVIVRIIEESTNTSVDGIGLNKIKLIAFTIKSDRVSDAGPRGNHGSENFRKNIKKRFRERKLRKEISKTTYSYDTSFVFQIYLYRMCHIKSKSRGGKTPLLK